jgi:RNase H-fold protein (predicted Holliday junction resolvase)
MLNKLLIIAIAIALTGCALNQDKKSDEVIVFEPLPTNSRSPLDVQKISEMEKQLADKQRQCLADKRRLEIALKDNQKQSDELQKKLDSLLAIDREIRSRAKVAK